MADVDSPGAENVPEITLTTTGRIMAGKWMHNLRERGRERERECVVYCMFASLCCDERVQLLSCGSV